MKTQIDVDLLLRLVSYFRDKEEKTLEEYALEDALNAKCDRVLLRYIYSKYKAEKDDKEKKRLLSEYWAIKEKML